MVTKRSNGNIEEEERKRESRERKSIKNQL